MLETVEIHSDSEPQYSIIWLHGLGADGNDFVDIVPQFGLKQTRFIFPHAKVRPITINGGMPMRAWYDVPSMNFEGKDSDKTGIDESIREVEALITHEIKRGIKKENIVIAGFSQGGAIALRVALQHQELKGALALSTYLLYQDNMPSAQTNLPILLMHGTQDPIIPLPMGEHAFALLKTKGYQVTFKAYAMQHQLCGEQLLDVKGFLSANLMR